MKPDDETIEKFQKIYFQEFGETISKKQAYEKFLQVTNLLRAILWPRYSPEEGIDDTTFVTHEFDQNLENGKLKDNT